MGEYKASALVFRISSQEKDSVAIKNFFDKVYDNIENCLTRRIDEVNLYIANIDRVEYELGQYYYLFTVSRADTQEPIIISDAIKPIPEREEELEKTEEQGLTNKARFIYCPFYNIIIQHRNREKINLSILKRYLKECTNVTSLEFDLVLEPDVFRKLEDIDIIEEASYSISSPSNISLLSSDDDNEFDDLRQFENMDAQRYSISLFGESLSKATLLSRIKFLVKKSEHRVLNVTKFEIKGRLHGEFETLDLIKHKLKYSGEIVCSGSKKDEDYYCFLKSAFEHVKEEIMLLFEPVGFGDG